MIMACLLMINLAGLLLPENMIESYNQSIQWTNEGSILFELLSIGIMGPVAEEVLFRGLMFGCLERAISNRQTAVKIKDKDNKKSWVLVEIPNNRKYAIIVSSLAFALSHGHLVQVSYAFVLGVLFCMVDYDYKSTAKGYIFPSIVMHVLVNSSSVLCERFGAPAFVQYGIYVLVGVIAFIIYRRERVIVKEKYAYYCDSITKRIASLEKTMKDFVKKNHNYQYKTGWVFDPKMSGEIQESAHGTPYVYTTKYGVGCGNLLFSNLYGTYLVQRLKDSSVWLWKDDVDYDSFDVATQYDAAFDVLITNNISEASEYFSSSVKKESLKDKKKAAKFKL